MLKEFFVEENKKISSLLEEKLGIGYFSIQKILKNKDIKVNGKRVSTDLVLKAGDKVSVYYKETEKKLYDIVFENQDILVINKPQGILSETVFESIKEKAFFIHRLDRNTSGLMIFAKNETSNEELLIFFKNRTFEKYYLATLFGNLKKDNEIMTAYLKKDGTKGLVKIYDNKVENSSKIITEYKVLERKTIDIESESLQTTLVEILLHTGKTHQIRAHFAHIGHFVIGDGKYGRGDINKKFKKTKQELKAYKLKLNFEKESPLYYLNGKTFEI